MVEGKQRHAETLRAWHLALLRFAVTFDNADRLAIMAIANEIDRLGLQQAGRPDFSFFRRTSAELCDVIPGPHKPTSTVLRQYLACIEDDRLRRAFAAAIEANQLDVSHASKPVKRDNGLWKGLSSRANH
jgi:hypothetical protein